jgi:CheY-like chemotaxis protein
MKTMIRFRTAEGVCLVPADHVLEVRSAVDIKPFPGRREDVVGLIERQGQALTVLSTLGSEGDHVLLLTGAGGSFGLLVKEVLGLVSVAESEMAPAPAGRSKALVEAVVKSGRGLELLISADELWRLLTGGAAALAPPTTRLADEIPLRLLLVEDNVVVQMLTKRLLSKLGYSIDVAVNGREAIEAMERAAYDIVFMDLHMPEMDGLETMKEIARRWPADHPAVIAMSAAEADSERQGCLDAGMSDYLSKPFRDADLSGMLRKWGPGHRPASAAKPNGGPPVPQS